ncbi:MAG TPA: hypothetical protein VF284_09400 [Rhodanobacteraceae bacterium]
MDDIQRSDFARQILDNPVFVEAFDAMAHDLQQQRAAVKLTDVDAHTKLIMAEQVMLKFKAILTRAVQDGDVAQWELAHKRTPIQRVFRR